MSLENTSNTEEDFWNEIKKHCSNQKGGEIDELVFLEKLLTPDSNWISEEVASNLRRFHQEGFIEWVSGEKIKFLQNPALIDFENQ